MSTTEFSGFLDPPFEPPKSEHHDIIVSLFKNPRYGFTYPQDIFTKLKNGITPDGKAYPDITLTEVENVLRSINSYTLNKRKSKPSSFNSYSAMEPFAYLQADLMFFDEWKAENDGYSCVLSVIDVYSRFAFARWMKTKSAEEVTTNFKSIIDSIKEGRYKTFSVQADDGGEFFNKKLKAYFKEEGIKLYSVESPYGAAVVERFNRTIKQRLIKYTTEYQTRRYVDVLQSIVDNYNNTYHTTIKMTPTEAVTKLKSAQKPEYSKEQEEILPLYQLVRVVNDKHIFGKEIHNNAFTIELFRITSRIKTDHEGGTKYAYRVVDLMGEAVKGVFYREDLALVSEDVLSQPFPLNVIRTNGDKVLVGFVGYPSKFDRWIDKNLIERL